MLFKHFDQNGRTYMPLPLKEMPLRHDLSPSFFIRSSYHVSDGFHGSNGLT